MSEIVLAILDKMSEIHTVRNETNISLDELMEIINNCLEYCPQTETMIIKTLKSDLNRIEKFGHQLPDLLSSISWVQVNHHYKNLNIKVDENETINESRKE